MRNDEEQTILHIFGYNGHDAHADNGEGAEPRVRQRHETGGPRGGYGQPYLRADGEGGKGATRKGQHTICGTEQRVRVSATGVQDSKATAEIQPTGLQREEGAADSQGGEPYHHRDIRISADAAQQEGEGPAHEARGGMYQEGIHAEDEEADADAGKAAHKTGIQRVQLVVVPAGKGIPRSDKGRILSGFRMDIRCEPHEEIRP